MGYGLLDTMKTVKKFHKENIYPEVIDVKSLSPLDSQTIINSVKKTGRLVVVDPSWKSFGASSEIISIVMQKIKKKMKSPPIKITYPDSHTPASESLEKEYYFSEQKIFKKVLKLFYK